MMTSSVTAVLAACTALISNEVELRSLHDVVGNLGLDVAVDRIERHLHSFDVVIEKEETAVEEVCDGLLVRIRVGRLECIVLVLSTTAHDDAHGLVESVNSCLEQIGQAS